LTIGGNLPRRDAFYHFINFVKTVFHTKYIPFFAEPENNQLELLNLEENLKKYTYVMWDWNGTLLDDVGAALESVNDMLDRRAKTRITMAQYHEYIDIPIRKFYEHLFDLEKEDYTNILKEYNDGYEARMYDITLAPGAREVLNEIRSSGLRQIVVSSCEQNQLRFYIEHFDLENYFDAVLGSEDYFAGSKVERAGKYLDEKSIDPAKVLVVGDLVHDYDMAKSIGASCILLSIGHHSEDKLRRSGAQVINSINQILDELV
jgi:phosphoglycolate phosphatase